MSFQILLLVGHFTLIINIIFVRHVDGTVPKGDEATLYVLLLGE